VYKSFFNLQLNPFEISPDPHFFYPTPCHYEAIANLYHAIQGRKGLVVITGEVGTGKTLLVRCLLEKLGTDRVQCAYVFNPILGPLEFLHYITADLGLPPGRDDKGDLLQRLNSFLIQHHNQGQTAVLILDEAHLLSSEVLEESRLLSNLETAGGKLLQIALVGQPEFDEKLDSSEMRQLKQRIALRCTLKPLKWEETKAYIEWRLKRAGANGYPSIFAEESLRVVYEHSRGLPRLINTICENALISAFAIGTRSVPPYLVEEACADLRITARAPAVLADNEEVSFERVEERVDQSNREPLNASVGAKERLVQHRNEGSEQALEESQ
jgi:general secretion pathway protein A